MEENIKEAIALLSMSIGTLEFAVKTDNLPNYQEAATIVLERALRAKGFLAYCIKE